MARTVTPTYCQMMARYNAWQNDQMLASMSELSEDDLHEDQGAFFGSILKTASHIHWADGLWVSRFDGGEQLDVDPLKHTDQFANLREYSDARKSLDARLVKWSDWVDQAALDSTLTFYVFTAVREATKPMSLLIPQFFNHQTHHRGQIHAMLTRKGVKAPVSDLFYLDWES